MEYNVNIDVFEGSLDLLLYLVEKNHLPITEISIAQITEEYLEYLEVIKELDLDTAGDFLLMATTLMQIKARSLLPQEQQRKDQEAENLVERLKEYQKVKQASQILQQKLQEAQKIFYPPSQKFSTDDYELDANLFDLLTAFKNLLSKQEIIVEEIISEDVPVEEKINEILNSLQEREFITFSEFFGHEKRKRALITLFLALLELIKLQKIIVRQIVLFGEIRIYKYSSTN